MLRLRGPPDLIPNTACLALTQANQKNSPLLRLLSELRNKNFDLVKDLGMDENNTGYYIKAWDRLDLSRSCRQTWAETAKPYFSATIRDLRSLKVTVNDMFDIPGSLLKMKQWERNFIRSVDTVYDHRVDRGMGIGNSCSRNHLPALFEVTVLLSHYSFMWWDVFAMWFREWTKKPKLIVTLTDGTGYRTYIEPDTFN